MKRLKDFVLAFYFSFPIQLLLNNFRRNHVLLLCWVFLFAIITGNFGSYLGIPYLFLDPEYLNEVNFTSFFIMGVVIAGFSMSFHITGYIMDGHRFTFVGVLTRPFTKFSINNSIIPIAFLITYIIQLVRFQLNNQYSDNENISFQLIGLLMGYILMTILLFTYFWMTNKDIFKYVVCKIDDKIKQNIKATRASAMKKLNIAKKNQIRVDNYLDHDLRLHKVEDHSGFYDRATILQVFDQNHFNLVVIQLFIFALVLLLGIFKDVPVFQFPAAATVIIFLTIFIMISGAFSYWFGGWTVTASIAIILIFNWMVTNDFLSKRYEAFGLDYRTKSAEYSVSELQRINNKENIEQSKTEVLVALNNWKNKQTQDKPLMVFICVSGGGQRASLWTLTALQKMDSLSKGKLFNSTMLISGASGGLIGASYFRELKLRALNGEMVNPYAENHKKNISSDNLNPLIFSILANDLFVGFRKFEYENQLYEKDRAYTFEEQLNKHTEFFLDKTLQDYRDPELEAQIPMLILSPTIINDARKLYISALPSSYMNLAEAYIDNYTNQKVSGVDFTELFKDQGANNLRFLSALRMSATFPYITPNTTLPSNPAIEIMDAGITDNFGINDAVRFMYAFRNWIQENTGGVVILSIRDSQKLRPVLGKSGQSVIDKFAQPISSIYNNFENMQDITNDNLVFYARTWLDVPIERIDIQYAPEIEIAKASTLIDSLRSIDTRASLSWRLTKREKESIVNYINSTDNRIAIRKLQRLLQ
jgi:hypothetical protein